MLPYRKVIFIVFLVTLIASILLLFVYFFKSPQKYIKQGNCGTNIESASKKIKVTLVEREKWNNFIGVIGNCSKGEFTVYSLDGGYETNQVREVKYIISDERQKGYVTDSNNETVFSYDYSYNPALNSSSVILNFPDTEKLNDNTVGGAIILISYKLFKGEPMREENDSLKPFFNNLSGLGLKYEKL